MRSEKRLRAALIASAPAERRALLEGLGAAELEVLAHDWSVWARPDQFPPESDWTLWLLLGGRGAGKTRAGAEWVRGAVHAGPPFAAAPVGRVALVGETFADVREVMIEGPSGLKAIHPKGARPAWRSARRRLEWPNGAVGYAFSAEDPEALRGPQFDAAWADEIGKWRHAEATWDMLQFGLRLGVAPRQVATTTPRPTPLLKRLLAEPGTVTSRAATSANAANLAAPFLSAIVARYAGTRLGRQELDGELIADRADALWRRAGIEAGRVAAAPELTRIVVAVDPPASSGPAADACGIVAAGLGADGVGYVVADRTARGLRPAEWATRAAETFRRLEADALVVEVNQGGEMVAAVIGEVDGSVPVTPVRASRGKWIRAEPVAALYEQGRVRHVGAFPELEDEMCDFAPAGLTSGRSPDRLDALVWALTALMLGRGGEPRVRGV